MRAVLNDLARSAGSESGEITSPVSFDEGGRRNLKREGDFLDHGDGRIAGAAFDVADIRAVDASLVREGLLTQPFLIAQTTQVPTEALAYVHGCREARLSPIDLQTMRDILVDCLGALSMVMSLIVDSGDHDTALYWLGAEHEADRDTGLDRRGPGMKPATLKNRPQFTGNAGLNYIGWQLSRRGWHVTPTIRSARGSDMFVTDEDETVKFGVQSKALSKRHSVPLGLNLEILRSDWWIITVHANSDKPVCYVMLLEEVQKLATKDGKNGNHWLIAKSYDRPEFREAWHRIDGMRQRNDPSYTDITDARALLGETLSSEATSPAEVSAT